MYHTKFNENFEKDVENAEEEPIYKPFLYVSQQIPRTIHHFYISSFLDEPIKYREMIFKIQTAEPDDVVYIHLNTPGGYLDTGNQIINSMQSSSAHIITSLEGDVASMGATIFLAADVFVVHNNSSMMIHNYTGGVYGKGHEQIAALESATKWSYDFFHRLYVPFISEEELDKVINGADLYLHPPEIRTRLENMVQILEQEQEEPPKQPTRKKQTKKKTAKKKVPQKKTNK